MINLRKNRVNIFLKMQIANNIITIANCQITYRIFFNERNFSLVESIANKLQNGSATFADKDANHCPDSGPWFLGFVINELNHIPELGICFLCSSPDGEQFVHRLQIRICRLSLLFALRMNERNFEPSLFINHFRKEGVNCIRK